MNLQKSMPADEPGRFRYNRSAVRVYEAEEGCLSLEGVRKTKRYQIGHQRVVLDEAAEVFVGGVGALVGLTGTAVVVLDIVIILADDAAHLLVVLALIGAFHALEIRHVRAPGVEAGTGAVDAWIYFWGKISTTWP